MSEETPDSKELTLNEYQALALQTAIFSTDKNISYLTLALCDEVGEVADKVKKVIRDKHGQFYAPDMAAIALELGDAMWYIANIAKFLGYGLSDIGRLNLEKRFRAASSAALCTALVTSVNTTSG